MTQLKDKHYENKINKNHTHVYYYEIIKSYRYNIITTNFLLTFTNIYFKSNNCKNGKFVHFTTYLN